MNLHMADSTTVANLPAGMDAYAGYKDGDFANFTELEARFPNTQLLSISTRQAFDPTADCLDIEHLDALDSAAPGFVVARAGLRVLYRQQSSLVSLMQALGTMPRSRYKIWSAHYNPQFGQHICGPSTCGAPVQADGTQWVDTGPVDLSVLSPDFFSQSKPMEGRDMPLFVRYPTKGGKYPEGLVAECSGGVATNMGNDWTNVEAAYGGKPPVTEDPNGTLLDRYTVHHGF